MSRIMTDWMQNITKHWEELFLGSGFLGLIWFRSLGFQVQFGSGSFTSQEDRNLFKSSRTISGTSVGRNVTYLLRSSGTFPGTHRNFWGAWKHFQEQKHHPKNSRTFLGSFTENQRLEMLEDHRSIDRSPRILGNREFFPETPSRNPRNI